jgi:OmpA-OmpF porin, OOP family
MKLRLIWLVVLFSGIAQAQEMELQVELMNRVATDTSRKGDLVSVRVTSPANFQGAVVEGKIAEAKSGAKSNGQSVLDIDFDTLRFNGAVTSINSRIKSVSNSKGQANVDEEGRILGRAENSNRPKGSFGLGRAIGNISGGKAARIGAATDTAAAAVLSVSSDAPNLRLDPGARFMLAASSRSGPALASLASSNPAATSTSAPAATRTESSPTAAAAVAQTSGGQPEMTVLKSTFVPGEKTIFYDDFTDMGPDDPPPHFKVRGPAVELRAIGNTRQLTVIQSRTVLTPNLTSLPANFTFEAELALETGSHRADIFLRFYSKNKVVFELGFYASDPTSDLVAQMKEPYSELGRKRFNTKWNEPGKLALWLQNGRLRIFFKDEKQLDFNQVALPPIDKVEIEHGFSGANAKSIGYRVVRFAESTPDFSQVITSSGRYVTHGILFDTDSDRLKPESAPVIQSIAKGLETNPNLKLLVEGHTDSVGNADHNMDLSKRRAEAVKAVLVSQFNIDASRLSTAGLGATKPIDTNDTPQGRSQNRRVELVKR